MLVELSQVNEKTFDYLIIGGGTVGLVLAARLTENPSTSVLVLEAGEANLNEQALLLPGQSRLQLNNPKYDWGYKTVEQPNSNNREYAWPRGKGLGGSSAINFLLWNKPAREYLQAFSDLGNEGWNWERFEEYSKRVERFTPPNHDLDVLTYDLKYRGLSGEIPVSFPTVISHVERPFIQAMKNLGIEHIPEPSSGFTNGTSVTASTIDPETHFRAYATNTYYVPNASRPNLHVLVSAHVSRINTVWAPNGFATATGVSFIYRGNTYQAYARREVCLCAGTVMSPQVLELSGIGSRDVLEKAGTEVKVELPGVGQNVQEHLWAGCIYDLKEHVVEGHTVNTMDMMFIPEEAAKQVALHGKGEGALNLITISLTFLPLNSICINAEKLHNTIQETILQRIKEKKYSPGLRKQYELQLKHLECKVPSLEVMLFPRPVYPPAKPDLNKKHVTIGFGLNSPFSRGTIHISSNDPLQHPIIDPHIYEEPYDLLSMVELVKFARKLADTDPLKGILGAETYPGPGVQTDEQISEWLKNIVNTTFHTVGTCSMLPLEDGGVVDSRLKVYNTTNIRVVDVSVIPLHIGSHTQVLAYAIGEQAADIIKGLV